ncbi:MAG: family permease [Actinomycetia bacterium]|nr:family permease [Actinomycetes bacterium]
MAGTTQHEVAQEPLGRSGGSRAWLLHGQPSRKAEGPYAAEAPAHKEHAWWQVMCLTGVDYFSSLGYAPGIAALAAGALSPLATIALVVVTLFGALPVYRRVAAESPHGQGSIAMLERLLPRWWGKLLVLALLGFAATDFIITITLSAADATAHALENPYMPAALHGQQVVVTLVLIAALGAVFLKGFAEAITIAVGLVAVYLALNVVVAVVSLQHVFAHWSLVTDWTHVLTTEHSSPMVMIGLALLVFPKLALGMSGFETGVAVMPLIKSRTMDERLRGTRKLLTTAAITMSVFLIVTSFASTVLIPAKAFQSGGQANGRAMAYLAHLYLGNGFGTVYDVSTIAILWFAGASAMAGLLNLVPRYLPRYGMAPHWTSAVRPLVLVFTLISFGITLIFRANVDAQGGAYATGVLVLMLSAAVAVTITVRRRRAKRATILFGIISLIFAYTTFDNMIERPEGIRIASFFIIAIIGTSLISRATRSTELRVTEMSFDDLAVRLIEEESRCGVIRIIANEPDDRDRKEYVEKEQEQRANHHLDPDEPVLFLEVTVGDASDFEGAIKVTGENRHGYHILRVEASTIANAIAAVLLQIRDMTGKRPHVYFDWAEGNPVMAMLRYLVFGGGDIAPLTREVLRQAEPDPVIRPQVHVG